MEVDLTRKSDFFEKAGLPVSSRDPRNLFGEISRLHREDFLRLRTRDICVFVPHCLRSRKCPASADEEGVRCRRCGSCSVGTIYGAAETHGLRVFCVPGGSALKPLIKRYGPKGLVGVACEKELLLALDMLSERGFLFQLFCLEKDGCFETHLDCAPLLDLFRDLAMMERERLEGRHVLRAGVPLAPIPGADRFWERYLPQEFDDKSLSALCGETSLSYDTLGPTRTMAEPLWDFLNQGGKGKRSRLFSLVMEAFGKDPAEYRDFMIIPEWTHNGTLIVDDIEDGSSHRRGKPCLHLTYGVDVAINAGNALYFLSLLPLLNNASSLSDEKRNRIFQVHAEGMIRLHFGQGMDIAWHKGLIRMDDISEGKYLQMTRLKTGSLFWVSARIAAVLADLERDVEERIGVFASAMGIGFQIIDDLLDIRPNRLSKGKGGVGKDITEGKITLMAIYALQHAAPKDRDRLREILGLHTDDPAKILEAVEILERCGATDYADRKAREIVREGYAQAAPCIPVGPARDELERFAESLWKRDI